MTTADVAVGNLRRFRNPSDGRSPRRQLKPGTVLVRDYHGQRHTVTVAPDGFDWQCTSARSRHARQIYLK
jgi:Protein of unknown function (DUF2924)